MSLFQTFSIFWCRRNSGKYWHQDCLAGNESDLIVAWLCIKNLPVHVKDSRFLCFPGGANCLHAAQMLCLYLYTEEECSFYNENWNYPVYSHFMIFNRFYCGEDYKAENDVWPFYIYMYNLMRKLKKINKIKSYRFYFRRFLIADVFSCLSHVFGTFFRKKEKKKSHSGPVVLLGIKPDDAEDKHPFWGLV